MAMKKWVLLSLGIVACAIILFIVFSNVGKFQEAIKRTKPEIREVSLDWGQVTATTTEVVGTITIYNPNSVPLPISRITCDIKMDGISVGRAETIDLQIEEEAEFSIKISAKIDNTKIPDFWAEHIRRNEKAKLQ